MKKKIRNSTLESYEKLLSKSSVLQRIPQASAMNIRRQEAGSSSLDSGESDLTYSYFNDSNFEENVDGSDLSDYNEDDSEESLASGVNNLENDERLIHSSSPTCGAMTEKAKLLLRLNSVLCGGGLQQPVD